MGKKAKLKAIRKAARLMPEIKVGQISSEKVSGSDLISQGVKEVQGKPVSPMLTYKKRVVIPRPLNHNKAMKRLYNQKGIMGVKGYIASVQQHLINQDKK